jgi:hypothetical protein
MYSYDLFKKPASIKAIVISVEFVPETIYIKDVMNLLTKSAKAWQWSLTNTAELPVL